VSGLYCRLIPPIFVTCVLHRRAERVVDPSLVARGIRLGVGIRLGQTEVEVRLTPSDRIVIVVGSIAPSELFDAVVQLKRRI
jgi:hypothetical protein